MNNNSPASELYQVVQNVINSESQINKKKKNEGVSNEASNFHHSLFSYIPIE